MSGNNTFHQATLDDLQHYLTSQGNSFNVYPSEDIPVGQNAQLRCPFGYRENIVHLNQNKSRKTIRLPKTDYHISKLLREVQIYNSCQHPNILHFDGISFNLNSTDNFIELSFFSPQIWGSLKRFLNLGQSADISQYLPLGVGVNEIKQKIIFGISAGLLYLSSKKIVIKNLNYESILLDDQFNPLLSDFELSYLDDPNIMGENYHSICESLIESPEVWKICYSGDPLSVDYHKAIQSEQSIIFSWGVLINSILGKPFYPFGGLPDISEFYCNDRRPQLIEQYPLYRNLISKGFKKDPNERPTPIEIIINLLRDEAMLPNVNISRIKEYQKLALTPFFISLSDDHHDDGTESN